MVLAARGREDLAKAAEAVAAAGAEPRVEICDFADAAEIADLFDRLETDRVSVDALVNNVGIARTASFEEVDDAEWTRNWEINVMSAVRCCRRTLAGMVDRGWGRIVNVSSSAGIRPGARWPAYAPTKSALQGLTMVLAATYGESGVTANAVCPGPAKTPMWTAEDGLWREAARAGEDRDRVLERVGEGIPAGRMGKPAEIGAAIAFLCSEAASFVNGAVLSVDGGNVRIVA